MPVSPAHYNQIKCNNYTNKILKSFIELDDIMMLFDKLFHELIVLTEKNLL